MACLSLGERSLPDEGYQYLLIDEDIELTGQQTCNHYSDAFHKIALWDSENEQVIELITNQ